MTKASLLFLVGTFIGFGRLAAADSPSATPPSASVPAKPVSAPAKPAAEAPKPDAAKTKEILAAYMKISAALAADNVTDAKTAAIALADIAGKAGLKELASQATATGKGADIATVRTSFKTLSATVEPLADGDKTYIVMFCPMAKADWIQTTKDVKNPYYGKAMLDCGGPKAK